MTGDDHCIGSFGKCDQVIVVGVPHSCLGWAWIVAQIGMATETFDESDGVGEAAPAPELRSEPASGTFIGQALGPNPGARAGARPASSPRPARPPGDPL